VGEELNRSQDEPARGDVLDRLFNDKYDLFLEDTKLKLPDSTSKITYYTFEEIESFQPQWDRGNFAKVELVAKLKKTNTTYGCNGEPWNWCRSRPSCSDLWFKVSSGNLGAHSASPSNGDQEGASSTKVPLDSSTEAPLASSTEAP